MLNLENQGHYDREGSAQRVDPPQPYGKARARPRVLVVDDDIIDRMLARAKLDALGCQTVALESGKAALQALAAEPFDLVFVDCRMPGFDGYQTTRSLRRMEARGETAHQGRLPVIAATAGPGYRDRCEAAGMSGVLIKPYSREDLRIILQRWSAHREEGQEGCRSPEELLLQLA